MSRFIIMCVAVAVSLSSSAAVVPLIVDTDIGGGGCQDVDDVAALCMAHALADNGEAELLAILQNTSPQPCAGVISVINTYYGRPELPIGAYKGTDLDPNASYLSYVDDLVANFPSTVQSASEVDDSVTVYRQALVGAEDHSVAISSIGLLTNLKALLMSEADGISPLNGYDLVALKVKSLAVMGGKYPSSNGGSECNFCGCAWASGSDAETAASATAYVVANMPPEVEVLYSGFEIGIEVQSGGTLSSCAAEDNPCRRAFEDYEGGPNLSRYSWDPLSTLAVVRGVESASCALSGDDGLNTVDASSGNNEWISGPATNQTYLVLTDATAAGNSIDELLCQTPASRRRE